MSNFENETVEAVTVPTISPQNQPPLTFEVDQFVPTVGDSSYSGLNEDETELLEYLQKAVAENDADFARQVRDILKEVCGTSAADRKKVWEALGDASRKIFTELLAVEILPEIPEVAEPEKSLEAIIQELADGLVAAIDDGPAAVAEFAAQFLPENVEQAIALLESLKDFAAVEEIRDALG